MKRQRRPAMGIRSGSPLTATGAGRMCNDHAWARGAQSTGRCR